MSGVIDMMLFPENEIRGSETQMAALIQSRHLHSV
jgi:hypothetical protein